MIRYNNMEVNLKCAIHGKYLDDGGTPDRDGTVTVQPCGQCIEDARAEGESEGYDKGYEEGEVMKYEHEE